MVEGQLNQIYSNFKEQFVNDFKKIYIDTLIEKVNKKYEDQKFKKFIRKKINYLSNLIKGNNPDELLVKLTFTCLPKSYRFLIYNNLPMEESYLFDRCVKVHNYISGNDSSSGSDLSSDESSSSESGGSAELSDLEDIQKDTNEINEATQKEVISSINQDQNNEKRQRGRPRLASSEKHRRAEERNKSKVDENLVE